MSNTTRNESVAAPIAELPEDAFKAILREKDPAALEKADATIARFRAVNPTGGVEALLVLTKKKYRLPPFA